MVSKHRGGGVALGTTSRRDGWQGWCWSQTPSVWLAYRICDASFGPRCLFSFFLLSFFRFFFALITKISLIRRTTIGSPCAFPLLYTDTHAHGPFSAYTWEYVHLLSTRDTTSESSIAAALARRGQTGKHDMRTLGFWIGWRGMKKEMANVLTHLTTPARQTWREGTLCFEGVSMEQEKGRRPGITRKGACSHLFVFTLLCLFLVPFLFSFVLHWRYLFYFYLTPCIILSFFLFLLLLLFYTN